MCFILHRVEALTISTIFMRDRFENWKLKNKKNIHTKTCGKTLARLRITIMTIKIIKQKLLIPILAGLKILLSQST